VALAATALVPVTALVLYFDVPEAVPAIGIPCLACLLWRRLQVSAVGMAAAAVTLELAIWEEGIGWRMEGNVFMLIPMELLLLAALGGLVIACVAFLVAACRSKQRRRRNALAVAGAPLAIVLTFFAIHGFLFGARELRIARQMRANQPVLQALIDEVDAIAARSGRVPRSEEELVRLQGKPMPSVPWPHWGRHGVHYRAISAERFALYFGGIDAEGYYAYDSGAPERGWHWRPSSWEVARQRPAA
jgi:hypothetical protein